MAKIVEDNKNDTGSVEKPDTKGGNDAPDNEILGIENEETEVENVETETENVETESESSEDLDPKDKEIEQLRETIMRLQKGDKPKEEEESSKEEEKKEETPKQETSFTDLTDEDFEKITSDKEAFVGFLNKFGESVASKTKESTYKDIPEIVSKTFDRQSAMKQSRDQFYEKNPDLKKYSDYVGYVLNKKQSDNPDKQINELLTDVESEVRKNLSLNRTAVEREEERLNSRSNQRRPAVPGSGRGSGRGRGSSEPVSDQQKQIDEILI